MYVLYLTWSFLVFPPCLFHVYHFYSACDLFIVLFSIDVISIVNRICTQIYLLFCVAYKKKIFICVVGWHGYSYPDHYVLWSNDTLKLLFWFLTDN